jgi:glycosyltransferase involved in cell wall biosynthesis
MRIAVASTQAPFVTGGAELHAQSLIEHLRRAGHEADLVTLPFKWYPAPAVLEHMLAARCFDLSESCGSKIDAVIGLKFPAYLMRHPRLVVWLLHQHREAYDLFDVGLGSLCNDPEGFVVRETIRATDRAVLGNAERLFTNSGNVAGRLKKYNGVVAEPLYHPPPLAEQLRCESYSDFFYYPSRISGLKRQTLVLEALAQCRTPVRCIFSGGADSPQDAATFQATVERLGLGERAVWLGHIPNEAMIDHYARARAVIFTPLDEDLGYITLEAMLAAKPVVTTLDAGGPLEFIRDGVEGRIVAPQAKALGAALDELWDDAALCRCQGEAARARYYDLGISWTTVIRKLVG